MNKLFIVLLAVCLVSAHAFVKRDAPQEDGLKKIQDQIQGIAKDFNEKLSEALNPEQLKKGFNDFVDNVNKAISSMKPEEKKQ